MPEIKTIFRSYQLRLWREDETGNAWRVMLESVMVPGERHYFKDLESLMAFILTWQEGGRVEKDGGE